MLIIEKPLNSSIKTVVYAIIARDDNLVTHLAKEPVEAGANMLDVNAGIGMYYLECGRCVTCSEQVQIDE